MLFIMGISRAEKKLPFDQLLICPNCGRCGHMSAFMRYICFMFFFLPLFRWDRRYYARMECCGAVCELDPELGKAISKGAVSTIDPGRLHFSGGGARSAVRVCPACGYSAAEDFQYCPKCGRPLN